MSTKHERSRSRIVSILRNAQVKLFLLKLPQMLHWAHSPVPRLIKSVGNDPRRLVIASLMLFALTRTYILFVLEPKFSDIDDPYVRYAQRAVDQKQIPYQGDFKIEYPPLGWWTILAPRLIDSRQIDPENLVDSNAAIRTAYRRSFRAMMFLCDVTSFWLLWLIARRRRPQLIGWLLFLYTLTTALLGNLLYDRLDIALLALLLVWAYSWIRSLATDPSFGDAWEITSYVCIGLSISFKLIPVICVPFVIIADWGVSGRALRSIVNTMALAIGAVLPFAIQYQISGAAVSYPFEHHWQRGIQIESIDSTLAMIGALLGSPITLSLSHHSLELQGALLPALKVASVCSIATLELGLLVWMILQAKRIRRQAAYCAACYVLSATVILRRFSHRNIFFGRYQSPDCYAWRFCPRHLISLGVLRRFGS